jgi:hypothetical protein
MPSYIDQVSTLGPKVWYRFNETAGTPVNFGSLSTTSVFTNILLNEQTSVDGRAIYLSGSSSIGLPSYPAFSLFDDKSFTIETWMKASAADVAAYSDPQLFSIVGPSNVNTVIALALGGSFYGDAGKVLLRTSNGIGTSRNIVSATRVDDDQWHHVVATINTTSIKIYIDGALSASGTPSFNNAFNFDVQENKKFIGGSFRGRLDEFAIYDFELTPGQIAANYTAGAVVEIAAGSFGTATSLMVQPTVVASFNPTAQAPMTASAVLANVEVSNFNDVNGIQKIISDFGPETWIKFDYVTDFTTTAPAYNAINYGSGGTFTYNAGSGGYAVINQTGPGQEPSIELQIGSGSNHLTSTSSNLFTTEISDSNFAIGVWFKVPTGIDTSEKQIFGYAGPNNSPFSLKINNKKAVFALQTSHTTYTHTETNDISENVWHLAVIKLDLAATTLKYYLDGTEVFSDTAIQGNRATPTSLVLGKATSNGTDTGSKRIELAHYFVDTYSDVTPTVITNLYNAGTRQNQAKGVMRQPIVRFQNKFDDFVDTLTPVQKLGFNETTGTVLENTGSNLTSAFSLNGSSYTRGTSVPTKNRYGYNFTNKNTYIAGNYSTATNSYADNTQTISVYAKINTVSGSDIQMIAAYGLGGGAFGIGLSLFANASGPYLAIVPTSNPANIYTLASGSTSYFGDYHLYTLKRDGTSVKLYIDGKQVASGTYSAYNFTDSGYVAIGGGETVWLGASAATVNKFIDEFAAFDYALSDQQIFEMWQTVELDRGSASSEFVDPTYAAGFGPTVSAAPMTASGLLPMPTEVQEIAPVIAPMIAFGVFQLPNFGGNVVIDANYGTTSMTADAEFHVPGFSVGEINSAVHMQASALMVHPVSIAGGTISVNPVIALDATLVMPGIVTIKGALVKAQSLNANAFAPLPPQYFTIADDLWYQRLVAIDQKDSVGASSIVFFNTSDNFYVPSDPIPGSGWTVRAPSGARATNTVTNPLPAINGGYFDAQNRKAVNFRNIEISTGAPSQFGAGDRDFTFEAMIRTSKSNQVLFVGENQNTNNFQRTGIVLRNGKLALTYSKDASGGSVSANDEPLAFIGNKNIADGEWHHIIIQNRQTGVDRTQPRIQFWIDGQLDIQRYGNEMYVINRVGYNSIEANSYSDFTISAFGLGLSAMVEENEINLNYLAAINVVPVKAQVATATATATPNNKGRGNRGRALMLYFWPTQNSTIGYYSPTSSSGFRSGQVGNNYHDYDQGSYGNDPDTFYQLTTYLNRGANQFYDWDIWPVPVTNLFEGDKWVGESHPILKDGIFKTGTDKGTVYVDALTDNERYINLMTDLKDLSQFDMICFRNYPDQSGEQDQYGVNAKGVVDEYFNLLDKNLFADFLGSLREAVDTGISLLITNPQLAVDMGFIDTYHVVSDLSDSGNEGKSDPYVPVKLNDPLATGTPQLSINYPTSLTTEDDDAYLDAYRNNYHQVVNTLTDLTDDAAFIWTDEIKYVADQSEFGELDRYWSHVEYSDELKVGDKFLISTTPTFYQSYFATPLDAVRAGKVITKFADTYRFGLVERVNPYRNYATSIAVEPGTVVAGKQIGAKVFISFTDVVGIQQIGRVIGDGQGESIEQKQVSLTTDYWINYAYSVGLLTVEERDDLLVDSIDRLPASSIKEASKYWTTNGQDIIGSLSAYGDNVELGSDTSEQAKKQKVLKRTRRGKAKKTVGSGALPSFTTLWGWSTKQISVPVPSINLRGLWWLSERLEYADGVPLRPEAFDADAFMKQPVVTGFKTATIAAQAAVAVGAMVETNLRSAGTTIAVLPLTATALFVEKGTFVPAEPATAAATVAQDVRTTTFESDQVVLYLIHVDPIVYLREDVIK